VFYEKLNLKYIHLFKLVQTFVRYAKKKGTFHSACAICYIENPALTDIHKLITASRNICHNWGRTNVGSAAQT